MNAVLLALPERGWGTVRDVSPFMMQMLVLEGYVVAQFTPHKRVFQARLTGRGRAARATALAAQ